jgi:molybdate transport system ATP-binding protein
MSDLRHIAIYTDNSSRKTEFAESLLNGDVPEALQVLQGLVGGYFSNSALVAFLEEEARHHQSGLGNDPTRELKSLSSGERKKALLNYLLNKNPDFLLLDDPFDNLDRDFQAVLKQELVRIKDNVLLIQLVSRTEDTLPFIQDKGYLNGSILEGFPNYSPTENSISGHELRIPDNPNQTHEFPDILVDMQGISLSYGDKKILNSISWQIHRGSFWELRGPNGSGKSTLITLISGDNPKAYGMNLSLFGTKKGTGESVWDIKGMIGYFTPGMIDRFRGYHSTENMLISGLLDSVGLYVIPGDGQRELAGKWLKMLNMEHLRDEQFCDLTAGQQRLIFCARAMIKHPPLLILDEPTAGLDAHAAAQVVSLIRKMAKESETAILFVSHRDEPGLKADHVFELIPDPEGSRGVIWE